MKVTAQDYERMATISNMMLDELKAEIFSGFENHKVHRADARKDIRSALADLDAIDHVKDLIKEFLNTQPDAD